MSDKQNEDIPEDEEEENEWGYCEICDKPLTEEEYDWNVKEGSSELPIQCEECRPNGRYHSSGYLWDYGETPECYYCGEQATLSTGVSGIHICDSESCAKEHADSEFDPIEWEED